MPGITDELECAGRRVACGAAISRAQMMALSMAIDAHNRLMGEMVAESIAPGTNPAENHNICKCDIVQLLSGGCTCGVMERERSAR
jgi:hypothetical protein